MSLCSREHREREPPDPISNTRETMSRSGAISKRPYSDSRLLASITARRIAFARRRLMTNVLFLP